MSETNITSTTIPTLTPESDTTPAPESDTTPAPKSDTTPAPESDTTPAPESDTTPAPESEHETESAPASEPESAPASSPEPNTIPIPAFQVDESQESVEENNNIVEEQYIIIDNNSRECYNAIKNYLASQEEIINVANMLQLLIVGIEAVESITHMSGEERKLLVIHAINKLVQEETNLTEFQKTLLINIAEEMIPNAIDIIINTSKGNYSINKKTSRKCCIGFIN